MKYLFRAVSTGLFLLTLSVQGQTFLLDDCPAAPVTGPLGFGCGAEDPWGFLVPAVTPSAPSPILGPLGLFDGDLITPGLVVSAAPGIPYTSSLSNNTSSGPPGNVFEYQLFFSVDRVSTGSVTSAVNIQAGLNQQPSDLFRSGASFVSPGTFIGTLAALPTPFAGILPAVSVPSGGNTLILDDSGMGIPLSGLVGVLTGPAGVGPLLGPGTHNNIDGFDHSSGIASGGVIATAAFQTAYPATTVPLTIPTADVFDMAPGGTSFCGVPSYATAFQMGLIDGDVIDGLVMFDAPPVGSVACGGIGAQPGIDGVLFSLAPGSPSLTQPGISLNPGDVMLSDFSGNFAVFASAPALGLLPNPGGAPAAALDNLDALEFGCLGDFNNDGVVNFIDITIIAAQFGAVGPSIADLDGNGVVNFLDLVRFTNNFGCIGG